MKIEYFQHEHALEEKFDSRLMPRGNVLSELLGSLKLNLTQPECNHNHRPQHHLLGALQLNLTQPECTDRLN